MFPELKSYCQTCNKVEITHKDLETNIINNKLQIVPHRCRECNELIQPTLSKLPNDFYIRICNSKRKNALEDLQIPKYEGYQIGAYLQNKPSERHFRTTKFEKNQFICFDSYSAEKINI